MTARRRAAVLGHPVAHSLSPVLHRAAYAALGLTEWRYDVLDVTEEALPGVVTALDDTWAGLSLTMPLKKAVIPLLDHVEPLAEVVGAVNTVLVQGAGANVSLAGANTDVHGMVTAFGEGLDELGARRPVGTAVVIGAGATAASALAALAELDCPTPQVHARSMARAGATMRAAARMGVEPRFLTLDPMDRLIGAMAEADVVVSTLPAHAADPMAEALTGRAVRGALLDCAYAPRVSALGRVWAAAGGAFVGGERMLLHQATEQVRLMTGRVAPLDAMESALEEALDPSVTGG